jgi:hypothetical protein
MESLALPVEVGTRGLQAKSMWKMLTEIGITCHQRKQAIRSVSRAAEKASFWLWLRRDEKSWC